MSSLGSDTNNYYYVQHKNNGAFILYNKDNHGLFLAPTTGVPAYYDGTTGYRLLTTQDFIKSFNPMPNYNQKIVVSNPYTAEFPCLVVASGGNNVSVKMKVNGNYINSGYIGGNAGESYASAFANTGDSVRGETYAGATNSINLYIFPLNNPT